MYVIYSIIIILFNTHTIWSCFGGSILYNKLELHKQKEFKPNDFTLLYFTYNWTIQVYLPRE